jgi:hypothetical protein
VSRISEKAMNWRAERAAQFVVRKNGERERKFGFVLRCKRLRWKERSSVVMLNLSHFDSKVPSLDAKEWFALGLTHEHALNFVEVLRQDKHKEARLVWKGERWAMALVPYPKKQGRE